MSEPTNTRDAGTPPDFALLGLLEKVSQFQWMLKLLSGALFLDCALMIAKRQNLLSYPWEDLSWSASIGPLIVGAVAYSMLIAAVLPVLGYFTAKMVRTAYIYLPVLHRNNDDEYRRDRHAVRPWELLEHADRLQSDYILSKYAHYSEIVTQAEAEASRLGKESFNALFLLILNCYLANAIAQSTIWQLTESVDTDTQAFGLLIAIGTLASLACISWCRIFAPSGWITYAPLYDEIERKREDERRRMRDLV